MLILAVAIEAFPGTRPTSESADTREFHAFLSKVYDAQVEFVQGWEKVGPRLDWGSAQFSKGVRSHEVLSAQVSGDIGYVVQIERIRYTIPGQAKESLLELRATMIMRREAGGWRLVHRHADSQMTRQAPR